MKFLYFEHCAPGIAGCSAAAEFARERVSEADPKTKKAANGRRPPSQFYAASSLFQLRGDAAEARVQLGADAVHGGDDRNRDAGGDQAIFDGRRSGLILPKPGEKLRH